MSQEVFIASYGAFQLCRAASTADMVTFRVLQDLLPWGVSTDSVYVPQPVVCAQRQPTASFFNQRGSEGHGGRQSPASYSSPPVQEPRISPASNRSPQINISTPDDQSWYHSELRWPLLRDPYPVAPECTHQATYRIHCQPPSVFQAHDNRST